MVVVVEEEEVVMVVVEVVEVVMVVVEVVMVVEAAELATSGPSTPVCSALTPARGQSTSPTCP